jgi:hypothetical protein
MAFLDEISSIFTGGLGTALEIEAERARADIDNKRINEDNMSASRGDSEQIFPTGTIPVLIGDNLALIVGGSVLAILLIGLIWRRA